MEGQMASTFADRYPAYMHPDTARALLAESRRRHARRRAERAWQSSVAQAAQSVIRAAMGKPVAPFYRGA
jgi:hypothetical protein